MKNVWLATTLAPILLVGCGQAQDRSSTGLADSENVAAGKAAFGECAACHSILGDGVGPDLRGVYGRKAGSEPQYQRYSEAMKRSQIIWNEQSLETFLKAPAASVKGNYMAYPGIKDPEKRQAVIAFLKSYK